jgi:hypothetical protein
MMADIAQKNGVLRVMLRPKLGETSGKRARGGAFAARTGGDDENGGHKVVSVLNKAE